MSLDTALFLVDRGGTNYRSSGADIGDRMVAGDSVLVQRVKDHFRATYDGSGWDKIQDDDLLLVWEDNQSKHVTGATFKSLFEEFDLNQCTLDARAEYVETHSRCESKYCADVAYSLYIEELEACYDAANQPYPPSWPPQLPYRP